MFAPLGVGGTPALTLCGHGSCPRESRYRRADAHLLRELVVDTSEMRELLQGYFGELDWTGGATKDALVAHLAGRDEALRTMVNEYVAEGTYQNLEDVMNVL